MKFQNPQISYYVGDIERSAQFYRDLLGFTEGFRTPPEGPPLHLDLRHGQFTLGLVNVDTASEVLGFEAQATTPRTELVLWSEDVDQDYASLVALGARGLVEPHDFLGRLRRAWIADPDGNPVQLVAQLS